jgi:protein TonB
MIIQKDGSISNVSVLRGAPDCPECDKEAVWVIKSMPNWVPAKVNGQPVNSYFNLPVRFRF